MPFNPCLGPRLCGMSYRVAILHLRLEGATSYCETPANEMAALHCFCTIPNALGLTPDLTVSQRRADDALYLNSNPIASSYPRPNEGVVSNAKSQGETCEAAITTWLSAGSRAPPALFLACRTNILHLLPCQVKFWDSAYFSYIRPSFSTSQ